MTTPSGTTPPVFVRSADSVELAVTVTTARVSPELTIVLIPGFSEWAGKPGVVRAAAVLSERADVVQIDLRGHGRSGGWSTLADREVLDVDAAVGYARTLGSGPVVTLGFSMGGGAALRHAALTGERIHGYVVAESPDAVVCISTGTGWDMRDTRRLRFLHWMALTRFGRFIARRVFRVRIDPVAWGAQPLPPVTAVARLSVPLLVVQGDSDPYVRTKHAYALQTSARDAGVDVQLWMEPGFGHAEEAAGPALLQRIAAVLPAMTAAGRTDG